MSEDLSREQCYSCPECHGGNVSMQHVVYYTWVSGELITVPDFPAWICDMCGMREYDQRALSWLKYHSQSRYRTEISNPTTAEKTAPRYNIHPTRSLGEFTTRNSPLPNFGAGVFFFQLELHHEISHLMLRSQG